MLLLTESLIGGFYDRFGYMAPFAFLLGAGMGMPIPEEVTMVGSGFLLYKGLVEAHLIITVCYVATLLGDSIPFWIGRKYGLGVLRFNLARRILHPERMALLKDRFDRTGSWAVFTFRFLPGIRMPGFFTAGTMGMSYGRFLLYDGAGALIMTPTWIYLGRAFGERIDILEQRVQDLNQYLGFAVLALVLVLGVRSLVRRRERQADALKTNTASEEAPGAPGTPGLGTRRNTTKSP